MKFSRMPYTGHKNSEIKELNTYIQSIRQEIQILEEQIQDLEKQKLYIRSRCDHSYLLSSKGPYSDTYNCEKCGSEIDR